MAGLLLCLLMAVVLGLTCDENCEPSSGRWQDHPGAWQWDALSIATIVAALAAIVGGVIALRGKRGWWVTAAIVVPVLAVDWWALGGF